jgi:hypothetical protein
MIVFDCIKDAVQSVQCSKEHGKPEAERIYFRVVVVKGKKKKKVIGVHGGK